ncbi:MAG: tyrosine-type recombinase/integrase [Bacteroidales bacterium]|jgi:integrase/recombinase XerC|nr:tyrosine-type recombinase/integrase [Bacteroidales bacterium]
MDTEKIFIEYLRFEKRYSEHTVTAYSIDIEQFKEFLSTTGETLEEVSSETVRLWIVHLLSCGDAARTVNRKISTLKAFYRFLLLKGYTKNNPMKRVISPKFSKPLPSYATEKEMDNLLERIPFTQDYEGIRDKTILELFYATGIRLSELLSVKLKDIDFQRYTISIMGKRQKMRLVPLSFLMKDLLVLYINELEKEFGKIDYQEEIFRTKCNKKMYPALIYKIVRKYLDMVSVAEKRSPHVLRHTFATHLLNNGADLNAIKTILGHTSLAATEVYIHTSVEKLKQIYKQAHPRA